MVSFVRSLGRVPGVSSARTVPIVVALMAAVAACAAPASAQAPGQPGPPQFKSVEVAADRHITFRIYAPKAQGVSLSAGDLTGYVPGGTPLAKAENGVWEVTVGPAAPGAYRYHFGVDGVATIDPRSPAISESNGNVWSLVVVSGDDRFDTRDVPHGAVSAVTYKSTALGTFRRMHVYTPPGYDLGTGRYPVFYLLHGAGDNDHAWSSVGRAGFILDNLIAAKQAKPMVVVMPAGHTPRVDGNPIGAGATEAFVNDFVTDVMPYVESHYRVSTRQGDTAIAGLSMGGAQTLAVAIPRLGRFGYVGVFSSGLLSAFPDRIRMPGRPAPDPGVAAKALADWESQNAAAIGNPALKKGLEVLWFATGKDDFLVDATRGTLDLLTKHGFAPVYHESEGGHTWSNWRDYLVLFAPMLFQAK